MEYSKKGQSTGPKTQVGKAKSSKNARKASAFTKGYLDWENHEDKRQQFEALAEQWQAYDPSREIILRSIEYAMLGQERLMYSERKRIEGLMASTDIAKTFCDRAGGFDILDFMTIPAWYFTEGDQDFNDFSISIQKVLTQAVELKKQYSDQLIAQVKTKYPELYLYLMQGRPVTEAFGVALGRRYGHPNPLLNLQALIDEIEKKYGYCLKWARDPHRYEIIIAGIRAEQMQEAMDLEKSTKYSTNFQNRILKGFAALSQLAQVEQQQLTYVAEKVSKVSLEPEQKNKPRDEASDDQKTGDPA